MAITGNETNSGKFDYFVLRRENPSPNLNTVAMATEKIGHGKLIK